MKKLVVLGGGESGVGAAILGKDKGMDVFLSDMGALKDEYRETLVRENIEFEEGRHSEERILDADIVVKSPGIPPYAPMVRKITDKNIPVLSEIEFAGRFTDAKIGKSLALQVARDPHDVYVIELSSFQLENMYDFKADIAVMMNITPDHLDRYDHKMENYVNAKFRILQNQTHDDYFIYWQDDPVVKEQIRQIQIEAMQMPFSEFEEEGSHAFVKDGVVKFVTPGEVWEIPRDKLSLTGLHNLYNSMAAGLSASLFDIKKDEIRSALEDFEAVEHRLEYVATVNGVRYVNDSKATNVNSTWYALESMTTSTVLILGGKDKGNDYSEIEELVKEKVKAIVCMGKDNEKLLDFFSGKVPVILDTHSMEDAVKACADLAEEGDTVLLSPCCASFDLFSSYEDRGHQFKECVKAMNQKN